MNAPLYEYDMFGEGTGLVVAVIIGFFFGLFLERGGLGNPRKLTGAFYLRDFDMPRTMFTAILVAASGLYLMSDLGMIDMEKVWIVPTFFWPQLVGGFIFGLGFLVSGYCPGTSVAGLATGRIDALVTMFGIVIGSFGFAAMYPGIEGFYMSSAMGTLRLQDLLGTSHWLIIAVLFACAGIMVYCIRRFEGSKAE